MSAVPAMAGTEAGIRVIPVWGQVTPALVDELTRFWVDHNAIGSIERAALRARQAVVVARDADGALCAVATAVVRVLPRLREPLYYYRQFFAPQLRGRYQALTFFRRAKQVLQAYNASLPRPESLGLLMELENPQLAAKFRRVVMPGTQSIFIGYSPAGLQLRVSYFDGATLLPPMEPSRIATSHASTDP